MNAWKLPDGRILIPKRAEGDGVIGDGLVLASAEEAAEWAPWTEPAPPELTKWWAEIEGEAKR